MYLFLLILPYKMLKIEIIINNLIYGSFVHLFSHMPSPHNYTVKDTHTEKYLHLREFIHECSCLIHSIPLLVCSVLNFTGCHVQFKMALSRRILSNVIYECHLLNSCNYEYLLICITHTHTDTICKKERSVCMCLCVCL